MVDKLTECLMNPVKCRLLMEIQSRGQATAKQLAAVYSDIPQATLYRNLKKMTEDGIIMVVSEKQVRGMVEKTYAPAFGLHTQGQYLDENIGEVYMQFFLQYIMGFIRQFQEYYRSDDIDMERDVIGFSSAPVYVTDEELTEIMDEMSDAVQKVADNKPGNGRKLRNIGVIISPEVPEDAVPSAGEEATEPQAEGEAPEDGQISEEAVQSEPEEPEEEAVTLKVTEEVTEEVIEEVTETVEVETEAVFSDKESGESGKEEEAEQDSGFLSKLKHLRK